MTPKFLAEAGFLFRRAQPDDLKCCVSNWFATEQERFMIGTLNRWPELNATIAEAMRTRNDRLLNKVYHSQQKAMMARAFLEYPPPLLCVDVQARSVILGWALGKPQQLGFVYVKEKFRHMGMGSALVAEVCNQEAHEPQIAA